MKITYWGHSCFSVRIGKVDLLFDPFISPNPLASHVVVGSIKPTHIFVSHGHEDHMADAIQVANNSGAPVVSNFEIIQWLTKNGLKKGIPMNIGGGVDTGEVFVKSTHAIHSSSMPDGSYGGTAMGFVATSTGQSFYYSGDTALTLDMKLVGEYHSPSIALLPIGGTYTMDIKDAIKAASHCKCSKVIGLHFDTFESIRIDHQSAISDFADCGVELILLGIGESISI